MKTKTLKKHILHLIHDESGQGTTEYILILTGIVALVLMFGNQIKVKISEAIVQLGAQITNAMGVLGGG